MLLVFAIHKMVVVRLLDMNMYARFLQMILSSSFSLSLAATTSLHIFRLLKIAIVSKWGSFVLVPSLEK